MTLIFSPNIQYLGRNCFEGCFGIYDVYFHEVCKIEELYERTFYNCSSLRYLHLSSSIKKIGRECFALCTRITNIQFDSPVNNLMVLSKAFWDCNNLQGFTNECNFDIIGDEAFYQCSKLSFPDTCFYNTSSFHTFCFYKCERLTKLKFFPNNNSSHQVVFTKAFVDCSNINSIDFSQYNDVPIWSYSDSLGGIYTSTDVFYSTMSSIAKFSPIGTIYIPNCDDDDIKYNE